MSLRFGLGTLFALAGGFLTVSSFTFSAGTAAWLAFGVSTGIAVLAAAALANAGVSIKSVGYGSAFVVGLWSLVAALVFSGAALPWLIFADALALVAVGIADLTLHEISTERVVHTIEVREHNEIVGEVVNAA
jgi:hypothetical protein